MSLSVADIRGSFSVVVSQNNFIKVASNGKELNRIESFNKNIMGDS
jgi:hypothetical protein